MSSRSAPGSSSDGAQGPVASSDGAAGPVATVAAYLPAHAERYSHMPPVGGKTASIFLQKIRKEATGDEVRGQNEAKYNYDLTNVPPDIFDWRRWISGRLRGNSVVVGPGIRQVFLAFFNEYDHNCKQARLDYLIVRTDGHAHRVHTHKSGHQDHLLQFTSVGWRQVGDAPEAGKAHAVLETKHGRPTLGRAVANFERTTWHQSLEPQSDENGMLRLPVMRWSDSGAPGPAVHIGVPGLSVHSSVPEPAVHSDVPEPAVQSGAAQSHRPTPGRPERSQSPPLPPGVQQRAQSLPPHVQKPAPPLPPQLQQAPGGPPLPGQELIQMPMQPPGGAQGPAGDSQQPLHPHVQKPAPPLAVFELLQGPPARPPPLHAHQAEKELIQLQARLQSLQRLRDVELPPLLALLEGPPTPQLSMQPPGGAQGSAGDSQQPMQPVGGATGHGDSSQQQTASTGESMHPPSGAPEPAGVWRSAGRGYAGGWKESPQTEWRASSDKWSGAGGWWEKD